MRTLARAVTRQSMEPEVPEKITINGEEYDPTEAQEYINLGRKTKEYETKWNTPLDNLMPDYGRTKESVKQLTADLQEARSKLEQFQVKAEAGVETPNDLAQAKEAARKLGLTFQEDLEKGEYIKKADLDKYYQEKQSEQAETNKVLAELDKLEKEIDGSDGRPKFNKKVVLAYARTYQIADLQKAYEEMNEDAVKAWKDQQVAAKRKPSLNTFSANQGNKEPKQEKTTNDNVNDKLHEALFGAK